MSRPRLLITECDRFCEHALHLLEQQVDVTKADLDRTELLDSISPFDAIWIRLRHQIDSEVFDRATNLRFVASPTTGLNHIDLDLADRRGIRVISLRGEVDFLREIRATAEHTVGLMLSLLRQISPASVHVTDGGWNRDLFCGRELHDKTIGIVGFGRLGKLVAKYLTAFDVRVLVSDPSVDESGLPDCVSLTSLEVLLAESDIVSIHVNLCDQTEGFFGAKQFQAMRSGSWFINTSRGELIDEMALLDSLRGGHLRGAALDVLRNESSDGMAHHPLVHYASEHSNLIITPHIGGCTTESMSKTEIFLAEKLCAELRESSLSA